MSSPAISQHCNQDCFLSSARRAQVAQLQSCLRLLHGGSCGVQQRRPARVPGNLLQEQAAAQKPLNPTQWWLPCYLSSDDRGVSGCKYLLWSASSLDASNPPLPHPTPPRPAQPSPAHPPPTPHTPYYTRKSALTFAFALSFTFTGTSTCALT